MEQWNEGLGQNVEVSDAELCCVAKEIKYMFRGNKSTNPS